MRWIDSLHDAMLRSITFDWRSATVRIELSRGTIVIDGVTSLVATRANAWGPSVSILEGEIRVVREGLAHPARENAPIAPGDDTRRSRS